MDATGAGTPVMDLFKRAQMGVRMVGTVVVGSGSVPGGGRTSSGYQTIARTELLTGLQVAVQTGRFRVSKTKCREWESWLREMELMRFEGKRAGVQDDLAFASALAVWWGVRL